MTDVKEKTRARDRRPTEVPHHPRVLIMASIVSAAALIFMGAWFWNVMTSRGLILTAEQQAEARAEEEAANAPDALSDSDLARQQEDSQPQPTDNPGGKKNKKSGPPKAPDASDPVTDQVELTGWSILSVNGILQVGGTLENLTNQPLSGTVKAYVYIDRVPVATAKTEVENLQPGETDQVNMVSDSDWEAGDKVIQLEFTPQ